MKKLWFFIISTLFVFLCFTSCGSHSTRQEMVKSDSVNISIREINTEQLKLDSVSTSYEIQTSIVNNSVAVIDKYFCYLYIFTPDGHLKKKLLGQGSTRNETTIGKIAGHCFSKDGKLFLLGFQGDTHIYDSSISLEQILQTDYSKKSIADLKSADCYNKPVDYSKWYEDFTCIESRGKAYFNVSLITPVYNIISTPDTHVKSVYNLMSIDATKKQEPKLLIKGLPSYYDVNTKNKAPFASCHFDIDSKGNFYVAHEADSLIYVYDKNEKLWSVFGVNGQRMKQNYAKCESLEDFGRLYKEEHATKGFYTSLNYIDETGILLRTYKQGGKTKHDRMQIYQNGVLIGDVAIPKGMCIAGYISPFYYSQVLADEKEETLKLYRFKL